MVAESQSKLGYGKISDDFGVEQTLRVDHNRNLRVGFPFGLKSLSVSSPGLAYVNGTNALCLVRPEELDQIRAVSIHLSAKVAGDYYLVVDNLDIAPGNTTNHLFDLIGARGDIKYPNTTDVVWAAFITNQYSTVTAGNFHFDCGVGNEMFLLAPNATYNLMLTWTEEIAEA